MTEQKIDPINILLSREELLFVLNALQADFIPGLDSDPLGELNPNQQDLVLTVAGRALQARELAQVQEDGQIVLHKALLTAVGACAYAKKMVFTYHWQPNSNIPIRYFGHSRDGEIVAHTRPTNVLHLFTLLPSKTHLINQLLTVCNYKAINSAEIAPFAVSSDNFVQIRQLANQGSIKQATEQLINSQVPPQTAESFIETLAHSPQVSIMQTLKHQKDKPVQKQDFTLLQNSHQTWLLEPQSSTNNKATANEVTTDKTTLMVKSINKDELEIFLLKHL